MTQNQTPPQGRLDKDMIAQPELWRLVMLLQPRRLDVVLIPPVESEYAIYRSILLDDEKSRLKAIESAIYDNPLLLSDFKRVDCLVDTEASMMIPAEVAPADYGVIMARAFSCNSDTPLTVSATGTETAISVMALDTEIRGFLTRTFYNIRFDNALAMLCRNFAPISEKLSIIASLHHGRLDIVILNTGRLLAASTFDITADTDAAFFIEAAMAEYDVSRNTSVTICGAPEFRSSIAAILTDDGISVEAPQLPPLKFKIDTGTSAMPAQLNFSFITQ